MKNFMQIHSILFVMSFSVAAAVSSAPAVFASESGARSPETSPETSPEASIDISEEREEQEMAREQVYRVNESAELDLSSSQISGLIESTLAYNAQLERAEARYEEMSRQIEDGARSKGDVGKSEKRSAYTAAQADYQSRVNEVQEVFQNRVEEILTQDQSAKLEQYRQRVVAEQKARERKEMQDINREWEEEREKTVESEASPE